MKDLENKMLVDEYWLDYDEVNNDEDEEESFYILADMAYDEDRLDLMQHGWGHVNGYYL